MESLQSDIEQTRILEDALDESRAKEDAIVQTKLPKLFSDVDPSWPPEPIVTDRTIFNSLKRAIKR